MPIAMWILFILLEIIKVLCVVALVGSCVCSVTGFKYKKFCFVCYIAKWWENRHAYSRNG